MPVTGINHINIRTTDIAKSAKFYVDVFGFQFEQGAGGVTGFQRNWLYDVSGQPIIHLRVLEAGLDSGPIDHVALNCKGKAEILEQLRARDIDVKVVENLQPGVTQVILKDPHGLTLELNFTGE
jgi:catechol 2,3-dioxygenase-like lactoylglutathione lyase family enzyme